MIPARDPKQPLSCTLRLRIHFSAESLGSKPRGERQKKEECTKRKKASGVIWGMWEASGEARKAHGGSPGAGWLQEAPGSIK